MELLALQQDPGHLECDLEAVHDEDLALVDPQGDHEMGDQMVVGGPDAPLPGRVRVNYAGMQAEGNQQTGDWKALLTRMSVEGSFEPIDLGARASVQEAYTNRSRSM